jgi:hypothetical protein
MAHMDFDGRLLSTLDYQSLLVDEKAEACLAAKHAGMNAVEVAYVAEESSPYAYRRPHTEIVENPPSHLYYQYCVEPLVERGSLSRENSLLWREHLGVRQDRLDPRVVAFLEGWTTRGREIIEIAEGRSIANLFLGL